VVKAGRLAGVLSIRDLLLAHPDQAVSQIMTSEVIKVRDEAPREEVIRAIEIYHLGAVPIVDAEDRLLGIVTADDAFTALEEEASEDVLALAGAAGPLPTRSGVLRRVRTRLPWLLVTLAGGLLGSFLIQGLSRWFGRADAVGPLGRFLPLVAGMAGNVAMQSAAVMVRGFATGEIPRFRRGRVIADEILVAGTVGCLCGAVAGLIAVSTGAGTGLATAVSLSIATASTLGGVSGTVIPTACVLLRIDPAVASGPFITTLNDLVGFAVYMTVAIALLGVVAN
jgi:magnesium transporter